MIGLVLVGLAALIVVGLALAVVGRETHLLAGRTRRPTVDVDAALDEVADALPFEVAARLSHAEVRQLLVWQFDLLAEAGADDDRPGDESEAADDPVVVDAADTVAVLGARAVAAGIEATPAEVGAVVAAGLDHLRRIGALAEPDG